MAAHSRIGASSSYRWLECPGSVPLSEKAPAQKSSIYADEGTAAHELAEKCLLSGQDAADYIGLIIKVDDNEFEVDEEMAEHVQTYIDIVRHDREVYDDFNGCETKIHLKWIHEDMFGTSDSHAGKKKKMLVVHDLKYGAGIPVDAIDNTQGLYYVLGVAARYKFDFEECEFVIVQPRAFHPDGPVRRWRFSMKRLREFERDLKIGLDRVVKSRAAKDIMAYLKPGDWCRFCPAAIDCPALERKMELAVFEDFDPIDDDVLSVTPTPPDQMTPERLAEALAFAHIMESWIGQIRSYAYSQAEQGNVVPGYKLVQKYGRRKWKNEALAKEILFMLGFDNSEIDAPPAPVKMKSPAQIEKLFKKALGLEKKFVGNLTMTPESGTTLVPEGDRRGALANSVEDDFTAVTDETD